ncbi:hypothetical protein RFI_19139 [Reticulomyxa filosa]|uniref:Uncharacterized protein n=1 Tax=Reticulomyxa filosa TaxID=46433 RepID=X6MWD0_RETFI|nr:hypothetical protein RFI_19139 [Reticulomyxa filosa]|eukprot:ETO18149.1 hypothetical protein RFI_19139 [Reticulomyxa filosa]
MNIINVIYFFFSFCVMYFVLKKNLNNALTIEINCSQYENMDKELIAEENYLKQFLNSNNNTCPVQPHNGCQYYLIKKNKKNKKW